MRLFAFLGKFALFLVGMAVLTGISLFVVGAYLATWPVLRVSPQNRRLQAMMQAAVSLVALARAYNLGEQSRKTATEDTEDTDEVPDHPYPYEDGDTLVLGPECFIARDGSVLCWRGENFIPQSLDGTARKLERG